MIRYSCQSITEADVEAVTRVLRSDWLTQGPTIEHFERVVAEYCGASYGVAVSSGTAALHLACLAVGLGPGDILWTSAVTFVASANCARYCGADVDFVDIDPRSYNMSVEALDLKLQRAARCDKLPKVVVVVHFAGHSCDMKALAELSRLYDFFVVEDAAHALGATYGEGKVGSCGYSDLTMFSFHPVKAITTGEGGMVMTNDRHLFDRVALLRNHGITRDATKFTRESHGDWYYEQLDLGYNYRMTDIQAALGISQMKRLDEFVDRRHSIVERYGAAFADLPLILPVSEADGHSAWHLYVVRLRLTELSVSRSEVFMLLREAGLGVNVHYIPVHVQPYYQALGFRHGDFPEAESFYEEAISLPLYPGLTVEQQSYVMSTVTRILQ